MCMAFERKGAARAQRAELSTPQRLAEQNNKRSPSPAVYAGERARGSAGGGARSAITPHSPARALLSRRELEVLIEHGAREVSAEPREPRAMPQVGEGDLYKYEILGADGVVRLKSDPFAFRTELRPQTASVVQRLLPGMAFDATLHGGGGPWVGLWLGAGLELLCMRGGGLERAAPHRVLRTSVDRLTGVHLPSLEFRSFPRQPVSYTHLTLPTRDLV